MHICLPDTREVKPSHGSSYLLYNVHIDGLYHCSLRFKQLLHLHQTLTKKFSASPYFHQLPPFPPKKLLPLSAGQIEERRMQLEKYLQNISQDKVICNSSIFNLFLLQAQRESTRIGENQVHLDVELVNGTKIRLQVMTHDSADAVLTAVCRALGLNDRYHAYFCLCLCGYDVVRDKLIIKRRLSFFESPYVTLQMAIQQQEQLQNVLSGNGYTTASNALNNNDNNICSCQSCSNQQQRQQQSINDSTSVPLVGSSGVTFVNSQQQRHQNGDNNQQYHGNHMYCYSNGNRQVLPSTIQTTSSSSSTSFVTHRILLRKSYWDPIFDTYILNDQQALNLLFIQTVYDIKHSLMFVDRETYHQLESLLASDSKMEYILLARTLKYYNYVHFEPCLSDYPRPRTKVMISIGSKELNMRVLKSPKSISATTTTNSNTSTITPAEKNSHATNKQQQQQQQPNNLPCEQILYCTSSMVPSGYHHLITKDDLVEEEYKFKVPLIRCWRLTSLETLNSNSITSPPVARNGRRKSLSLFNSVLGSSNATITNGNECAASDGTSSSSYHNTTVGTGGHSLLAVLTGSAANGSNYNPTYYRKLQGPSDAARSYCAQHTENQLRLEDQGQQFSQYELSFEYLISKDTLKWITISSDQAIFISISLQGVVDELVSKRDGRTSLYSSSPLSDSVSASSAVSHLPLISSSDQRSSCPGSGNKVDFTQQSFTYMYRDGTQKVISASNQQLIDEFGTTLGYSPTNPYALAVARQRQQLARASSLFGGNSRLTLSPNLASNATLSSAQTSSGQNLHYNRQQLQQHQQTSFEVTCLKKAPSPIINDAFEGVSNDEDL